MEIQFHGYLEIDPTRDMHFLPMALKDSHFENFSDLPTRLDGGRKEALPTIRWESNVDPSLFFNGRHIKSAPPPLAMGLTYQEKGG